MVLSFPLKGETMTRQLLVMLIVLVFISCSLNPDTTVVNSSGYTVSFQFSPNDTTILTLDPNTSTTSKYFYTSILIQQPEKRVIQSRDGGIITISDLTPWEVHAENQTESPVTLEAGGWMDAMVIPANGAHNGKVYTKAPVFSVSPDVSSLDVQFVDGIFKIVIINR